MTGEDPAVALAVAASGLFFLAGLAIGCWKYGAMATAPDHRAPVYVDIAHRASLMYSFAALVLAKFAEYGPWPTPVTVGAVAIPLLCFASAIGNYLVLGWKNDSDNQYERRTFVTTWGMGLLIAGEIGGFGVLFAGFLAS